MFVFERQNAKLINNPSLKMVARQLRYLKNGGKSSFASLSDKEGNWVQVGGGKATCFLERKKFQTGRIYRAWQEKPVLPKEFDQTILTFGGGICQLAQQEWFEINQVVDVFEAFLLQKAYPFYIHWRDITSLLCPNSQRV
jgi:hypothetical protein